MATRDLVERRKRIGEILGEGCFKTAADYAAAALVYQHGDAPDHYLQAFLWSKRAVELGDPHQKYLMALAIDRYLVKIGKKQLFGSQATAIDGLPTGCWCLQPVEPTFPTGLRKDYTGKTLNDLREWLASLNRGKVCPANPICADELKPSSKGTVPGFW